jgi:IMP dehydrogenase
MRRVICFDDILLEPKYSELRSRVDIDLSSTLFADPLLNFALPIISAPMDTVTESEMTVAMHRSGGLGIIHRYNSIEAQAELVHDASMEGMCNVGAAIGVSGEYLDRATALYDAGANLLCIDIAHGHHKMMRDALHNLREVFGDRVHLMAGNVATLEAFNDLADWGAHSIRVGVGGGSICSTRVQTGHGVPTLQSVIDCARSDRDVGLIADGGIKNPGDMVKALAAGADFVMCGSLLAGTDESPGKIVYFDGEKRKTYRGMASREAQTSWRNRIGSVEGVSTMVAMRGPVSDVLHELEWGLRSGLSYSGANNLFELRMRCNFLEQTHASQVESLPHALLKL